MLLSASLILVLSACGSESKSNDTTTQEVTTEADTTTELETTKNQKPQNLIHQTKE
ncbi:MAG: hypothetical protein GX225_01935 [Clostridiales bacterium]|nr:hypothetical protein [Clostridiales bacterium]